MFINFTNHTSENWSKEQLDAAKKYGEVIDIAFPNISPEANRDEINQLADEYVSKILENNPTCVLCQGEFCFSYAVINKLKENNIKVVAACSERIVAEETSESGTRRISYFKFVRFREY